MLCTRSILRIPGFAALAILLALSACPRHAAPTARFSAAPRSGPAPLAVTFIDESTPGTASVNAWLWEFGDGNTSGEQNPVHTYAEGGVYTVSLTVSTDDGEDTWTEADYIVAEESGEGEGEGELFVEVPDPLAEVNPVFTLGAAAAPAAGQSVPDADFGLSQTRVTQTLKVRHEYSRHDPFNADQSMIVLQNTGTGDWFVYRTSSIPYDKAAQQVTQLSMEEPRWDPDDPNLLWGSTEFRVITMDMNHPENDPVVVKDFASDPAIQPILAANPDLYHITMKDEGESSADKRFWAFILQGSAEDYRARYLFTWDRQTDDVLGVYTIPLNESEIDWVGMSVNGQWVLIGGMDTNTGNIIGLTMADKQFTQFHRIDFSTAHADVGLDIDGNEVVVMQNVRTDYIDLIPVSLSTQPILESGGSYTGTNRTPLVKLNYASGPNGFNSGVHISCNTAGYCVVSTAIESTQPAQNWLDRKIILVQLDAAHPRAFYLAKVYGDDDAYWEETHGTITKDGKKVLWATNWGLNPGQENVWDMMLSMPAGWQQALDKAVPVLR